jgi:hypothetical protein
MKLIDELVARAADDDKVMGQLADEEAARQAREKAYDRLAHAFDAMAEDGHLDKREIKALIAEFRAQGLDPEQLEALAHSLKDRDRVAVTSDLRNAIADELRDARSKLQDPDFGFKVQVLVNDYDQAFETASRVSKDEHEMYMTAVRNLVA